MHYGVFSPCLCYFAERHDVMSAKRRLLFGLSALSARSLEVSQPFQSLAKLGLCLKVSPRHLSTYHLPTTTIYHSKYCTHLTNIKIVLHANKTTYMSRYV